MHRSAALALSMLVQVFAAAAAHAQWTNRYPKVEGYAHHVYLEGYELPVLTVGPMDAAPYADRIAVASRGWIWILTPDRRSAHRLTRSGGLDSRPAWSPDGATLAFVRDDSRETSIVAVDVASGEERTLVDEVAIDLDPAFAPDGGTLYYASSVAGDLDLWRMDLATGQKERLTTGVGLERRPLPHPDGDRLVYLRKPRGGQDEVRVLSLSTGEDRVLHAGRILSQLQPALSPDGRTVALNVPDGRGDWELRSVDVDQPGAPIRLTAGGGLPLAPAWSGDGRWIYFSEADTDERLALWRVPYAGGTVESVPVHTWDWGQATGTVRIRTLSGSDLVAARLSVVDASGHPLVTVGRKPFFEGQHGRAFFYGDGVTEIEVPVGPVTVTAARGLATPAATANVQVEAGRTTEVELELTPIWDARAAGWLSGDHHFHLNYGGSYDLDPGDLVLFARGEDLDVATPLLANLHNRFEQQELWGWSRLGSRPWIQFGQEVRSHFLGHVSLLNVSELFWPWVWGPGYQVYGRDDRTNATALAHSRPLGGVNAYVHPVFNPDPFGVDPPSGIPTGFIPDAVLGYVDGLEIVCLWSNDVGTMELWYRLLNLGVAIAPTAGTDVMTDFYRTMAVGSTRVYVRSGGSGTFTDYMEGLAAGRSFVTTGPLLDFTVDGHGPGDTVEGASDRVWNLAVHSTTEVDRVEVVVNGRVVWSLDPTPRTSSMTLSGSVELPSGGWVAARAFGPAPARWSALSTDAFAHTAPVWIDEVGSVDVDTRRDAATDLLRALDAARQRLDSGYGATDIPKLTAHFDRARAFLEERAR